MPRLSAGLLCFRRDADAVRVLLVHPGGPLWAKKDEGAWSIPKGEPAPGESLRDAALRETSEEIGIMPAGDLIGLVPVRQAGGKMVHAWAVECDVDTAQIRSNEFEMEWPPKSGQMRAFPEIDRAGWFTLAEARTRMLAGQRPLLDQLTERLDRR
jgi:predicted NUDIX family NTP pyrophosphohydrolase